MSIVVDGGMGGGDWEPCPRVVEQPSSTRLKGVWANYPVNSVYIIICLPHLGRPCVHVCSVALSTVPVTVEECNGEGTNHIGINRSF